MRLTFRQGIVRHQTDINGTATFLQRSSGDGQFIDLIVSPDPTVLAFAHRDGTYIIEEMKTIALAWGPINSTATRYLYWDVNLLTGALTRGMTLLSPMYSGSPPVNPLIDQHWFDTTNMVFQVWTVQGWADRVRLFAGSVTSGAIIHPEIIGSQAGLVGPFEGGHIVLDSFGSPLRQNDGSFVTSATHLNIVNLGTVTARLEELIASVMALEQIPKYSLVQLRPGQRAVLARSTDYRTRISGLVLEDMYEGDVGNLITSGVVKSTDFNFGADQVNRPLFCGPSGQLTSTPPTQGALQQVGFVYDTQSIFVHIHQVVVLDDPVNVISPPPPPPTTAPIANFTASPVIGFAPLTVNFTSTATSADSTEWDFTYDGYVDATGPTAVYTYEAPGVYTVRQRVFNAFGQDDEVKVSFINVSAAAASPVQTNLSIQFSAPIQVTAAQPFSFQVVALNSGNAGATNVIRTVQLRTNNGSQVSIQSSPPGTVITYSGVYTVLTFALIDLPSGTNSVAVIQATVDANATSVQLEGTVSSPETDSSLDNNASTLTIGVKP